MPTCLRTCLSEGARRYIPLERQIDEMFGQAQRRCPYNGITPDEIEIVEGKG